MKIGIRPSWAVAGLVFRSIRVSMQQRKNWANFLLLSHTYQKICGPNMNGVAVERTKAKLCKMQSVSRAPANQEDKMLKNVSPKNYLDRFLLLIPFNLSCTRKNSMEGEARHLSLVKKAKKSLGDGLGGRPSEEVFRPSYPGQPTLGPLFQNYFWTKSTSISKYLRHSDEFCSKNHCDWM